MGFDGRSIGRLADVIDRVEGSMETLTVYDYDGPEEVVEDLYDHFGRRLVMVREATTGTGEPSGFAVLHDGEEFVAASDVEAIHEVIRAGNRATASEPTSDWTSYPDVLEHASTTVFSSYDKYRMVLASREVERRAREAATGELRMGFQELSLLAGQWERYCELADRGIDVHVYGAPDAELPAPIPASMTIHPADDAEIREHWFVAFDGPDDETALLLSEERRPGRYYGCWTRAPAVVETVATYLRAGRPDAPGDDRRHHHDRPD